MRAWLREGRYDDLLVGFGDGMAAGLAVGLGSTDGDTAFRRSASAMLLGECIRRDTQTPLVPAGKVLQWGDQLATWLLRERTDAIASGADALAALAASAHVSGDVLTALLQVIVDRVLEAADTPFAGAEADRLAAATLAVLRRNLVPEETVASVLSRCLTGEGEPEGPAANSEAYLRALYLRLSLTTSRIEDRADLVLRLVDHLRVSVTDL
jgi:hypothetical protein